ncbi:hypothetical protein DFP72DRAFT_769482, partial [Ephemerocybe angulata]
VPVPIGPAIPRRNPDNAEGYARYSRLMLILFKPWRSIADLRQSDTQAWAEALEIFLGICDPFSKERMRNMQVLHECKDSRD